MAQFVCLEFQKAHDPRCVLKHVWHFLVLWRFLLKSPIALSPIVLASLLLSLL